MLVNNHQALQRKCPKCGSVKAVRNGRRYVRDGTVQVYRCKDCHAYFCDLSLKGVRNSRLHFAIIAIDLYLKKVSIRDIRDHIWQVYDVLIPTSTIHFWVKKLMTLLCKLGKEVRVGNVGDRWLADEMKVRVKGKEAYLWNVLDSDTRKILVMELMEGRGEEQAASALKEAITKAGKIPKEIVTDGLKSYSAALAKMGLGARHQANAGITKKDKNNNRIEAMHTNVRQWIRAKKGVKSGAETFRAFSTYYNTIKTHSSLGAPPLQLETPPRLVALLRRHPQSRVQNGNR
jgi:transposase-like protein/predicted RNA-binding Zn-ribbon protein involved in translation (DUF1610 family)